MDFSEPDHILMLRESLRRFVEHEMPRSEVAKWDQNGDFPSGVFAKLSELGVMGLTIPEEYGGTGRDILATMVVIEELARRSLAVAIPYLMAACYAGMNILEWGSEEQKKKLLSKVATGEMMFAYGWTEPDVGADLASVKTVAVRDGDGIVINGSKRFCSGVKMSNYIYTLVRSGPVAARHANLSIVLIPPDTPGVTIENIDALGLKGVGTSDVTFSDVRVPFDNLVGGPQGWDQGWQMIAGTGLDVEKLEVAALALGIASAAFDDAWLYAGQRRQFGKPISSYQSIRHKLADMRTQLHASRLMLYHAAWLSNTGQSCGLETSMTKLFVTEAAKIAVLECQTIFGAYGYVKGVDVERYVRDVLLMPIIGGSSSIQRNNIAKWSISS
jgi:alkylation response protein AidB-like acyl-CoA dehydrogenase